MEKVGRVILSLAVIAVVGVGTWLILRVRVPLPEPSASAPVAPLIPQPTPTIYPSPSTIVRSVNRLSRLETVSYHIEKVLTAETGQGPLGFLFGDRLLLVVAGEVIGGVDLGQLAEGDVAVSGDGTLFMRLPPAEVLVATLDNERTYVYDRRTGVIGLNPELETAARREAERLVLEAALEIGLEEQARANAETFLTTFLLALGFEEVVFTEVMPTPTPVPTPTLTPTTSAP
jgi:hypothetical protein